MDRYYPQILRHPDTATVEFEDFTAVCVKGCDALNNHDKIHDVTSPNNYLVAAQICNFSPQICMRTAIQMSMADDPEAKRIGLFRVIAVLQNGNLENK
jgi:hypothetical protein